MRTSLNKIQQAEAYLQGKLTAGDKLVFETQLLLNPAMQQDVANQQKVYDIVQAYSRKQLKAEIAAIHTRLFHTKMHISFRERILNIFRSK
jgi:anti-sigma factor RsiW